MHSLQKAQLSLEFLLVMAGFVLVFALFVPIAVKSTKNTFYALEIQKAKSFLSNFKNSVQETTILSNGTVKEIKAKPLTKWFFSVKNRTAEIKIENNALNREHSIKETLSLNLPEFSAEFEKQSVLRIEKSNGKIFIQLT